MNMDEFTMIKTSLNDDEPLARKTKKGKSNTKKNTKSKK